MMKTIVERKTFGVVAGCDFFRWYFGVAYETQGSARSFVFRFGPAFVHIVYKADR